MLWNMTSFECSKKSNENTNHTLGRPNVDLYRGCYVLHEVTNGC